MPRPSIHSNLWRVIVVVVCVAAVASACSVEASGTTAGRAAHAPAAAARHAGSSIALPHKKWRLIWDSEFSGLRDRRPDPRQWEELSGDWTSGDGELEYYRAAAPNVSLDGSGHLVITAIRQSYRAGNGKGWAYTSGRVDTYQRFSTKYGRIEARIKVPAGSGLWPAFWALSTNVYRVGWPTAGEIDMMEYLGATPNRVYSAIHGPGRGLRDGIQSVASRGTRQSLSSAYHTYGMVWSPGKIIFTFDGEPYAVETRQSFGPKSWVFDRPFFLVLNVAVGGSWGGTPASSTPFPARMDIDWVRVYS